jgi:glycosyltransferase involved in cell wall biosynthesis
LKILFLTDNFYPEVNAPANRTFEHAKYWVTYGAEVVVLTGVPNFPIGKLFAGYKNRWKQEETIEGIKVIRVWTYMSENRGFLRRTLDYLSYAVMAVWFGKNLKTDVIIATSPQMFCAMAGHALSKLLKKPWIMEVRDIWPESITAVGAVRNPQIIRMLEYLEKKLYNSARSIVVVTSSFKDNLVRKHVSPEKIFVIKNGVELTKFFPGKPGSDLKQKLGLDSKVVVSYFGTHGMAHGLDFILSSVNGLNMPDVHFLFIGDGAEKQNLILLCHALGLRNVTMLPSVPKEEIINYLQITDIALVCLKRKDTFKSVIPSKIFENAAMGIPVLLGVEGESAALIQHYRAGECYIPEDELDFRNKLYHIIKNRQQYTSGCMALARDFDRSLLAHKMYDMIIQTIKG